MRAGNTVTRGRAGLTSVPHLASRRGLLEQAPPGVEQSVELVQGAGQGSPIGWVEEEGRRGTGVGPPGLGSARLHRRIGRGLPQRVGGGGGVGFGGGGL